MSKTEILLGRLGRFMESEDCDGSVEKLASLQIKVLKSLIEDEEKNTKRLLGLIEKVRKDLGGVERNVSDLSATVESLHSDMDALHEGD